MCILKLNFAEYSRKWLEGENKKMVWKMMGSEAFAAGGIFLYKIVNGSFATDRGMVTLYHARNATFGLLDTILQQCEKRRTAIGCTPQALKQYLTQPPEKGTALEVGILFFPHISFLLL